MGSKASSTRQLYIYIQMRGWETRYAHTYIYIYIYIYLEYNTHMYYTEISGVDVSHDLVRSHFFTRPGTFPSILPMSFSTIA